MTSYMDESEIVRAAAQLETLATAVIENQEDLMPVVITVYQPQGFTPHFLRRRKNRSEEHGYAFGHGHANFSGVIIVHRGEILFATRYEFPRGARNLYVLNTSYDYVKVWLVDDRFIPGDAARHAIDAVSFQIERLLPDGHPLKRDTSDEPLGNGYACSSMERRSS